jgi:hypothetical protein
VNSHLENNHILRRDETLWKVVLERINKDFFPVEISSQYRPKALVIAWKLGYLI